VRLNYIVQQQADVLSVPYDAVYTNQTGEQCILILEEQPTGAYLVKELAVTPELENDLAITISGSGVAEGLRVINDPEGYQLLIGKEIGITG
jgi:HlyD family secretion protein